MPGLPGEDHPMIRRSLVSLLMVSSCLLFSWGGAVALYAWCAGVLPSTLMH